MREVMQHVTGGLLLYGAIWALENSEIGQGRMAASLAALRDIGGQWVTSMWITSVTLVVLSAAAVLAGRVVPVPRGVGLDRADAKLLFARLAKLLLRVALVASIAAAGFSVLDGSAVWGITLLAASTLILVRWVWQSARRLNQFLNPRIC